MITEEFENKIWIYFQTNLSPRTRKEYWNIIKNFDDVQSISSFYTAPVGYEYLVVLTICVDGNMTTFDSHKLADTLEHEINKLNKIYSTTIHVNPI